MRDLELSQKRQWRYERRYGRRWKHRRKVPHEPEKNLSLSIGTKGPYYSRHIRSFQCGKSRFFPPTTVATHASEMFHLHVTPRKVAPCNKGALSPFPNHNGEKRMIKEEVVQPQFRAISAEAILPSPPLLFRFPFCP